MRRAYRFITSAQWQAGASRGFADRGEGLQAQSPLAMRLVQHLATGELAAADPCTGIRLLGPHTSLLRTWTEQRIGQDGRLFGLERPFGIAAGSRWLWVAEPNRVLRYDPTSLQQMDALSLPGLAGIADDRRGGLWTIALVRGEAVLRHVDGWGLSGTPVANVPAAAAALAVAPSGQWLAMVIEAGGHSQVIIRDLANPDRDHSFALPVRSSAVAIYADTIVLGAGQRLLWFERNGAFAAEETVTTERGQRITGLFVRGEKLFLVASDGLYQVVPAPGDSGADRSATFVTPTLISPPGTPSGWRRADLDVTLPKGATARVSVATSDDRLLLASVADRLGQDPAERLGAVEGLLPWRDRDCDYRGEGERTTLSFPLNGLTAGHLWLRVRVTTPAGVGPAVLHRLTVHYPDRSWIEQLPAIYQEDPAGAVELRRYLAPLERMFEALGDRIAALPASLDPATAPDDRLSDLLRWIGLPGADRLPADTRRRLLAGAGDLLVARGTLGALREVLRIVTDDRAEVSDSGGEGFLWVLGADTPPLARLGVDTRIVLATPARFRLGRVRLGSGDTLGEGGCVDVAALARAACGAVRVRIALPRQEREAIDPVLADLFAVFVPASCRIDLVYVPPGTLRREPLLDVDARVDADPGDRLGATSRAGRWRLPVLDPGLLTLDDTAALAGERRIA